MEKEKTQEQLLSELKLHETLYLVKKRIAVTRVASGYMYRFPEIDVNNDTYSSGSLFVPYLTVESPEGSSIIDLCKIQTLEMP